VTHLASLGHRRIAHLAGPLTTSTGVTRARAFRSAVRDLDLDDDIELVTSCDLWNEENGARALSRLLDKGVDFTAVVAGNDLIALGCYDVFAERGIDCPGEISVVGFNDMPFADRFDPPLTTVRIPHREIGACAADLLLERLADGEHEPRQILLEPTFAVRRSTAPPAVARVGARRVGA